jgi:hypothetical protein
VLKQSVAETAQAYKDLLTSQGDTNSTALAEAANSTAGGRNSSSGGGGVVDAEALQRFVNRTMEPAGR